MAELKPCPFCGDNQQLNYVELSNGLHYIECARCGAAPHRLGAWNRETAVKYWNSVSRWIACSERMPETDTPVICYTRSGQILVMELSDDDGWYCGVTRYYPRSVTHWMPLPETPKED